MPFQIKLINVIVNLIFQLTRLEIGWYKALRFDSVDKQTVCNYCYNLVLIFSLPLQVCALQGQ